MARSTTHGLTRPSASHEHLPSSSSPASVVAEVGGDRGAVIVHVPPTWTGIEIEIRRQGAPWQGEHVAVLERRLPSRTDHSAFFPSLAEGAYEIRRRHGHLSADADDQDHRSFVVTAAAVTHVDWTRSGSHPAR